MSAIAKLLAQKHELIERLHEDPGPEERNQIERLLEQIDAALDSLDNALTVPPDPYVVEQ
jgi:hypothetical protein